MNFISIASLTPLFALLLIGITTSSASARAKCSDFATQQEAQTYMQQHGATYLDGDKDGEACESLPRTSAPSSTSTQRSGEGPGRTSSSLVKATIVSTGDGDTLRVQIGNTTKTIRLAFIDAPESSQLPYGPAAGQRLKQLLPKGRSVSLRVIDTDRYGRTVAVVYAGSNPINLQMVQEGYAVVYRQYLKGCQDLCTPLQVAEADAKRQRLNFWSQSNPVMPWDYRKS